MCIHSVPTKNIIVLDCLLKSAGQEKMCSEGQAIGCTQVCTMPMSSEGGKKAPYFTVSLILYYILVYHCNFLTVNLPIRFCH